MLITRLSLGIGVVGLVNLQMAVKGETVYILEANPRASRTVPFVSKATGIPLAKIAAKVMIGKKLKDLGIEEPRICHTAVKEVLLPFNKLPGVDTVLGPEMKSTGEVMGIDYDFCRAYYKACISADNELPVRGNIFISVISEQKDEVIPIAKKLRALGLALYGTSGTVDYLSQAGVDAHLIRKVQEGSPKVGAEEDDPGRHRGRRRPTDEPEYGSLRDPRCHQLDCPVVPAGGSPPCRRGRTGVRGASRRRPHVSLNLRGSGS